MNPEHWRRLEEIFHEAAALSPEERAAFLDRACLDDAALRASVERLIAANDRAIGFLESSAFESTPSHLLENEEPSAPRQLGPYRVLRELARGGMGAVYLAERADGEFDRRVAIKLIKHGMDLDQVVRRFRAERQILASLEHHNIARLLDGGTTEHDRPYFVMEYVEGEAIDVHVHSRGLTVPDRLRLFLQVCDAVAYAHRHRVIHRDIKPANILVTLDGVPKLLDFGIAKVVDADVVGATSAITGLRVLTPEYASPEQVEGRSATEASDVYSLGVVLYELLTARSPYHPRSNDPLDVAEAVRTSEPERPSLALLQAEQALPRPGHGFAGTQGFDAPAIRRQLRGDLDTIVLAALRKEPHRRYQTVDDLAQDIRRHLEHLPIRARPDSLRYRSGKFVRRNRPALLAALVTSLAVTATLGLIQRSSRIRGGDDSLIGSGALALRDRVLVADFADRARDPSLAAAVTDAFRIDLNESPLIGVLTSAQVHAARARMELAQGVALVDSLAHEVALREGAKAMVTGSIARLGNAYTVSVQLVGVQQGEALASHRETAADSSQLLAAVDRASKALRRRIGESLYELRDVPSLEQVTTASLPALRSYTTGYRLFVAGERTRAIPMLQQAVALDTGFASAHFVIASIYGAMAEPGRAWAASAHALANRDRLPFLERQFLAGSNAYANEDYQTAIEEYDRVLERIPDHVSALNNLALAYRESRRFAIAESLWHRAIGRDSTIGVLYYGVHSAQVLQSKFDDARRTMDGIATRFPDDPLHSVVEVQDAAARQAWEEAEARARTNIAAKHGDTLQLVDAYEQLAGIVMTRGRLDEAERLWQTQLGVSAASESWGRRLFGVRQLATLEFRYRGRREEARALVDSALARQPLDSILPGDRPYHEFARFYAALEDAARGRMLLAAGEANDRSIGRTRRADQWWTEGLIDLAEGRLLEAEAALEQAAANHICPICPLPDLARAREAAGKTDEAIATYERYMATPWLWRYETDAIELGFILQRLGDLYEQRRDTMKAIDSYRQMLELWQRADGETLPYVESVKRRLAQLRSG